MPSPRPAPRLNTDVIHNILQYGPIYDASWGKLWIDVSSIGPNMQIVLRRQGVQDLLRFCLISRDWTVAVQRILYSSVYLENSTSAVLFARTLGGWKGLGDRVRFLEINFADVEVYEAAGEFWACVENPNRTVKEGRPLFTAASMILSGCPNLKFLSFPMWSRVPQGFVEAVRQQMPFRFEQLEEIYMLLTVSTDRDTSPPPGLSDLLEALGYPNPIRVDVSTVTEWCNLQQIAIYLLRPPPVFIDPAEAVVGRYG